MFWPTGDPGWGYDFHSLRHNFCARLESVGTPQNDGARLAGHEVKGMTYGVFGEGELTRLASIVQSAIKYEGVQI
jgi:hypothetical protein